MNRIFKLVAGGVVVVMASGCRAMTYVAPDGRAFAYVNAGFDTKVGAIEVKTHDGASVRIEGVDSSSKALEVADSALKLANKAVVP